MTLDEVIAEMGRGCCSAHRVAETGCTTCEPTLRAIEAVRALAKEARVGSLREASAALVKRADGLYGGYDTANAAKTECYDCATLVEDMADEAERLA